jgi:hypothetical protein
MAPDELSPGSSTVAFTVTSLRSPIDPLFFSPPNLLQDKLFYHELKAITIALYLHSNYAV